MNAGGIKTRKLLKFLSVGVALALTSNCGASIPTVEPDWGVISKVLRSPKPVTWRDENGNSIAYYHLQFGSTSAAERAIELATVRGVRLQDADNLLRTAIELRAEQVVVALLKNGASPHGDPSLTPLMLAASFGHLHIMRILLEAGADPQVDNGSVGDAMEYALSNGHYLAAHLLADNGLDMKKYLRQRKSSPIFGAIDGGSVSAVIFLISYGADLDVRNLDGESPLAYAKRRGRNDMVAVIAHHMSQCKSSNCR